MITVYAFDNAPPVLVYYLDESYEDSYLIWEDCPAVDETGMFEENNERII